MLWNRYDAIILDLDGVVYIGQHAVPDAIACINAVADSVLVAAATNNASRQSEVVAKHLQRLGLMLRPDDIVTSAQAGASLLASKVRHNARILAVGGEGVDWALREQGLHPIRSTKDHDSNHLLAEEVEGVMQGHGQDTSWWDLSTAAWAISRGKMWVATNRDLTVPTPFGLGPGNGALVGAMESVTGLSPIVAGKPQPTLFLETAQRIGAQSPLVIGDRLDTDIDGAIAAGMDSLLVLTGVHQRDDVALRSPSAWPTYVADNLKCLLADNAPPQTQGIG